MPSIVKIVSSHLYIGFGSEETVNRCFKFKRLLDEAGVKYSLLVYPEDKEYGEMFDNLSSWVFDTDYHTRSFKEFPIMMWQEIYDNYDHIQLCAQTMDELRASRLVANKNLIR
jgi:hypothetical protein